MTKCAVCVFWERAGVDGVCKYNPPVPVVHEGKLIAVFARTGPEESCGKGEELKHEG